MSLKLRRGTTSGRPSRFSIQLPKMGNWETEDDPDTIDKTAFLTIQAVNVEDFHQFVGLVIYFAGEAAKHPGGGTAL